MSTGSRRAGGAEETRTLDELYRAALADGGKLVSAAARVRFRSLGTHRPALDDQAATTLFRIAQNALANVREHAHAVNVPVTFHRHPDRVELEVSDDGVGFDPAATFASERAPGAVRTDRGFGFPAARAHLRECGGDLDVSSAPGRGTRIRALVSAGYRPRPVEPSFTPATSR